MDFLTDFFNNFHFLRPWFLLALIPAVLLFALLKYLHSQQTSWNRAIEPDLLPYLLDKSGGGGRNRPLYGLLVAWVLAAVALAGPVWEQIPTPVQERQDALVVVLDLSLSMQAGDLDPDRVTRARRKLRDLLDNRRDEGLTALVAYAGDAHAVTPLTDDVETINNLIPALEPGIMPVLGSKPETGISQALELLDSAGLGRSQLLLMTDGINEQDFTAIENRLAGTRHTLGIMGIGTEEGAPVPTEEGYLRDNNGAIVIPKLDRGLLRELARATGGRYADIRLGDEDIDYLLDESIFEQNENLVASEREFDDWREAGPWLVLLALPIAALAFRQGWLFGFCLLAVLLPGQQARAQSLEWQDLWETPDQQGSEVFEQEDYDRAARLFQDERWQAAAHYRNEDYEQAVEKLSLLDDAESHYNRGNALAHLNRYEEALAAYDSALERDPDLTDARHNREVVEELLRQQEQQQQQGDGDQQQNDQQEQQQGDQQEQQQGGQQNQDQQDQDGQEQEQEQQSGGQDQQQEQGQQESEEQQESQDQDQDQSRDAEQQQGGQQNQDQQEQDGQEQEQQSGGQDQQQEQGQQESEEQQESQDQDQSRDAEQQEGEQQDGDEQERQARERLSQADAEEEQAMQQWLRRIPDDPGELLRNKFEYQTRQQLLQRLQNPNSADEQPEEQTW